MREKKQEQLYFLDAHKVYHMIGLESISYKTYLLDKMILTFNTML